MSHVELGPRPYIVFIQGLLVTLHPKVGCMRKGLSTRLVVGKL